MRKCSVCDADISDDAKFCSSCGTKINKKNNLINILAIIIVIFCAAFCAGTISNYNFEKKYLQPSEYSLKDNSHIYVSYDKENKTMNVVYKDHLIKQWQEDYIKHYNLNKSDLISLSLIYSNKTEELKPVDVKIIVGKSLEATFLKNSCTAKDFIKIKKGFNDNKTSFSFNRVIDPLVDERQKAKVAYQDELKRIEYEKQQRELRRQEQLRLENLSNYLYYNSLYY